MADPHIQSELDALDKLTVILYRSALTASAGIMSIVAWEHQFATVALVIAALLATTTVHIYDKRFRWLILGSACLPPFGN
ncbi:arabinose efflux permease [Photobacterium aphoticum]|uniref:Arabinose efflux permease n=1 Tax=Photobacterium aphoticum TaxID=754436 RepID=A0A090QMH8_9GAMM|nr:arabinose efflux permease [Photobacterium aphoticum]